MARTKDDKADGKRGSYNPRAKLKPIDDPQLDAIAEKKANMVPDLKLRPKTSDSDTQAIAVGTKLHNSEVVVFMQPFKYQDGHRVRFNSYDRTEKTSQVKPNEIKFEDELLDPQTLTTTSGKSRWPKDEDRTRVWKNWMLFVWQTTTGETLPDKKAPAPKRKRDSKTEPTGSKTALAGIPEFKRRRTAPKRRDSVVSELDRPVKRHHDLWMAYDEGDFNIGDDNLINGARRAHRALFRGDCHPTNQDLRDAYNERVAKNLPACTLTQAWLLLQNRATGSATNLKIDTTKYFTLAYGPLNKERIEAASGSAGFQSDGRQDVGTKSLPNRQEAERRLRGWIERGRNMGEPGMDEVRLAKLAIEKDEVQIYDQLFAPKI